jgi:hypothetical protein
MQNVYISPGKALCRFCGEQVAMHGLSTHIAKKHARPKQKNTSPKLVRKHSAAPKVPAT